MCTFPRKYPLTLVFFRNGPTWSYNMHVLLYMRSPKGGCCSISDDLFYSYSKTFRTRVAKPKGYFSCFGVLHWVKEKRGDLTQSYDKNPYTDRIFKKGKETTLKRHQNVNYTRTSISGTEPSSVVLSQTCSIKNWNVITKKCLNKVKPKGMV